MTKPTAENICVQLVTTFVLVCDKEVRQLVDCCTNITDTSIYYLVLIILVIDFWLPRVNF